MRWFGLGAIVFVILAIAEIVAFVLLAKAIGLVWAILIAIVTSAIGLALLRREGSRGWRRFRTAVAEGRPPGRAGVDGAVGLLGAVLLLTPGFISDAAGLLLLAPPIRAAARAGVRRAAESRISPSIAGQVFGPRSVRARCSRPATVQIDPVSPEPPASTPASTPPSNSPSNSPPPPAIEGEIVE
jgi:UPF0716 protein FxsA